MSNNTGSLEKQGARQHNETESRFISIGKHVTAIIRQFDLVSGNPALVEEECDRLYLLLGNPPAAEEISRLLPLFPLLQKRSGAIAEILFLFLERIIESTTNPSPYLEKVFDARDPGLILRALDLCLRLAGRNAVTIDKDFLKQLSLRIRQESSPFRESAALDRIQKIIPFYDRNTEDPLPDIFVGETDPDLRNLAAVLLDHSGRTPSGDIGLSVFGKEQYALLAPYLEFTRATFSDLLALQPAHEKHAPLLDGLERAERLLGKKLLREVIAQLGWTRCNFGLSVERLRTFSFRGSPPLIISEEEAVFFKALPDIRLSSLFFLITATGGKTLETTPEPDTTDPVSRFQAFNLVHAELLNDFLQVAPLTAQKVRDMIRKMDRIVEDYSYLFSAFSDECAILPGLYQELKDDILRKLDDANTGVPLSHDVTRLVQSFEDPQSMGNVRTLHGLKRYLHQQGLNLGFRLVESGRSPNRTIDLLVATQDGIQNASRRIRYADFDAGSSDEHPAECIPFSVKLLIEGISLQMIHGREDLPYVDIFCYGNEVHYYFGFRNHPAFLRIDYAPPLRGGMIDLKYFGVSNYELDMHPNLSLDALRLFFRRFDFDLQLDGTKIHARYDKERALSLSDILEKARYLFRLSPYLMDLDWTIGFLDLDKEAQKKVAEAWADFFMNWGYLPVASVLTKDRRRIRRGFVDEPTGRRELCWSGTEDYEDIYSGSSTTELQERLMRLATDTGIGTGPSCAAGTTEPGISGQMQLNIQVLEPLRQALRRGEIVRTERGYTRQSSSLFRRVHEAECFAEMLSGDRDGIIRAAEIAAILRTIERHLVFTTTGKVNGYPVQKAVLTLREGQLGFFVLRGADGMIRLAFFILDCIICQQRATASGEWKTNALSDRPLLNALLRSNSYLDADSGETAFVSAGDAETFVEEIKTRVLPVDRAPLPEERILNGFSASPGQSVGRIVIGTSGRSPTDVKQYVLLVSSIKPEDAPYLFYAAGIVSTGGSILSHAGLIAMQYRKPALIIKGEWDSSGASPAFCGNSTDYRVISKEVQGFEVCIRTDLKIRQQLIREGDLVLLDADSGTLRILGQGRNVLALYEGFRLYAHANRALGVAANEKEVLTLRGRRLRARYQIEGLLRKCTDPVNARYAVFEILLHEGTAEKGMHEKDKILLLSLLINNPSVQEDIKAYLTEITEALKRRFNEILLGAEKDIPTSESPYEILALRLQCYRIQHALEGIRSVLVSCGIAALQAGDAGLGHIDALAREQLGRLGDMVFKRLQARFKAEDYDPSIQHLLRQLERIHKLSGLPVRDDTFISAVRKKVNRHTRDLLKRYEDVPIIPHKHTGFELHTLIGWKAANLGEIERITKHVMVPPWFAVTDKAFREALNTASTAPATGNSSSGGPGLTLQERILSVLRRHDLNCQQKAIQIAHLWDHVAMPETLCTAFLGAYREIICNLPAGQTETGDAEMPFAALRSSSGEEDTESFARAGEFETYLYIRGDAQLLHYLKRTWSGLWTERAIHNRTVSGQEEEPVSGGVIVQRIVNSRVSGVMQTVNIPRGNYREIVINAGLGLGEGIVSGTVAADQITVSRDHISQDHPLRFNYIVGDKTEQVVFNRHAGSGTVHASTLYHQRLRPALEYVELYHLVEAAVTLEKIYGYPLDIEFGIEENRLWILQVRPIPACLSVFNDTLEHHPLGADQTGPSD